MHCGQGFKSNGILFPKLFWPTVRKSCSSNREKKMTLRLKAENLQNSWDHQNNLFEQWKVRTSFETEGFFKLIPGGFLDLIN